MLADMLTLPLSGAPLPPMKTFAALVFASATLNLSSAQTFFRAMELSSPISPASIEACSNLPSCTCGTVTENFPPFVSSVAMSDGYTAHLSALPAGTVALNVAVFPPSFRSASERASVMKSEPSSQTSFSLSPLAQLTLPVSSRVVLVETTAVAPFS